MQRFWTLFIIVILVLVGGISVRSQETSLEPIQRITSDDVRIGVLSITLNDDGSRLATTTGIQHENYIWNTVTGQQDKLLFAEDDERMARFYASAIAWSPNGKYIAIASAHAGFIQGQTPPPDEFQFYVWDTETSEVVQEIPAVSFISDFVPHIDWSTDSRVIAWHTHSNQTGRSHVGAWDVENQVMLYQSLLEKSTFDIALTPDGSTLTISTGVDDFSGMVLQNINLLDGTIRETETPNAISSALDWNHNGTVLSTIVYDEDVQVRFLMEETDTGQLNPVYTEPLANPDNARVTLDWKPHDNTLAIGFLSNGEITVEVWYFDTASLEVTSKEVITPEVADIPISFAWSRTGVSWSGDGNRLAVATLHNAIWIYER